MTAPVTEQPVTASEAPAVETPAVETQAPAPKEPQKQPTSFPTKQEARRQALERARQGFEQKKEEPAAEEPAVELVEGEQPVEEGSVTEEAAKPVEGEVKPPEKKAEAKPAEVPEELQPKKKFVVEMEAGHPASGGMKRELIIEDAETARVVKALLNGTYARRKDVEEAQTREMQAHEKYIELKTRLEAEKEWRGSESYRQRLTKYQQLRQLENDGEIEKGTAQEYLDAGQIELDRTTHQKLTAERESLHRERVDQAQRAWTNEAYTRARQALPSIANAVPTFRDHFDDAIEAFQGQLVKNRYPHLQAGDAEGLHKEFSTFLNSFLVTKSDVRSAFQQINSQKEAQKKAAADRAAAEKAERARIEKEAVDRHMKNLATSRQQEPPHPLGNLGSVSHDRAPTGSKTDEIPPNLTGLQARKHARQSALARARALRG